MAAWSTIAGARPARERQAFRPGTVRRVIAMARERSRATAHLDSASEAAVQAGKGVWG